MKAKNILWSGEPDQIKDLPREMEIPNGVAGGVCLAEEIRQDYCFLLGYRTGEPREWWYGIEGITFIYMGAWSDPYIGYGRYAINSHDIEDAMVERYREQFPEPDDAAIYDRYITEGFSDFMKENREEVFEMVDDRICLCLEAVSDFLTESTGFCHEGFEIEA